MNKIKRSSRLVKAAFAVLLREKKLLLFPLVASGLALVMALFFLVPIALYPTGHSVFTAALWTALMDRVGHWFNLAQLHDQHGHPAVGAKTSRTQLLAGHPLTAAILAVAYFVSMVLATFSNVAFYHEIMQALNGNAVSIQRGYRYAAKRWQAVLLWSLFAGLVGYVIRSIEERVGFLGRIITGFIGLAWSVSCIFIIPAMARDAETVNPIELLRNSAVTLKRTWGELVIGFVGLELAFGAIFMVALLLLLVVPGLVGFYLGLHHNWPIFWTMAIGLGAMFLVAIPLSWISSMVNPVYRCALYIYATEGVVPGAFDKELLDSAWKVK